jgi:hypothetical protein
MSEPGSRMSEKVGSVQGSGHKIGPPQLPQRWEYQNVAKPAAPAMSTPATMAAIHRRRLRPMLAGTAVTVVMRSWDVMGGNSWVIAPVGTFAYSLLQ